MHFGRFDYWNLKAIASFIKVAELQNMTSASLELHVSQPALSQQIQKIELELGVQLFTRTSKGIQLTYEGDSFYTYCKEFMNAYDVFLTKSYALNGTIFGSLDIGYQKSSESLITSLNKMFHEEYPNVSVRNYRQSHEFSIDLIDNGQLDIIFINSIEVPENSPKIRSIPVRQVPYMVLMPLTNPLAHQKRVHLSELADMTIMLPPQNVAPKFIQAISAKCREYGFIGNITNNYYQLANYIVDMMVDPMKVTIHPYIPTALQEYGSKCAYAQLDGFIDTATISLVWNTKNPNILVDHYVRSVRKNIGNISPEPSMT